MPNTKFSREALKTHLHYGKWVYVAIIVGVFALGSMIFTMTRYMPPSERTVVFQIVGGYANIEPLEQIADEILTNDGAAIDPTLEEIGIQNIVYSGDASTDVYGAQNFMVKIAAGEGDIFMVNRELTEQLVLMGGAQPLDEYINSGIIDTAGMDIDSVTFDEPAPNEDEQPSGVRHVYALSASGLVRMTEADIGFDVSDKYLVLMVRSTNPETSVKFMQRMMDALSMSS